ncbi:MAG: S8 family serine peptidase, partial [Candidatus Saccharibacteria bacterium]
MVVVNDFFKIIFKNKRSLGVISFTLLSIALVYLTIVSKKPELEANDKVVSVVNSDIKKNAPLTEHFLNDDLFYVSAAPNGSRSQLDNVGNKTLGVDLIKQPSATKDYIEGEVIVKYRDEKINLQTSSGVEKSNKIASVKSLSKKEDLNKSNISVFAISDNSTVEEKIKQLESDPGVEYAEPNYKRYTDNNIGTNDTYGDNLWGLKNVGQTLDSVTGTSGKDIGAIDAWTVGKGSGAIVAVIDTGVAYNHPDLINQMWDGVGCKDYNGNSLGSCNYGYDFEDNDKTPLPTSSSHGTHVAGTIAAEMNNGKGIAGVAPSSKIMALKVDLSVAELVQAIDFAIQNGAKVINASYGGGSYSTPEYNAISRFKDAGGIFIAAAGNGGSDGVGDDNDSVSHYPSSYNLDNIISVAATDQNDGRASFSNYGSNSVDVGAPGVNIYSAIDETIVLDETFESFTLPGVPSGWVKDGTSNNWGTYNLGGSWGKVLYGDLNKPYANNTNTSIVSSTYDLSSSNGATMNFWTKCDTPYSAFKDYMALDFSSDGGNTFTQAFRWDELSIDTLNGNSSSVDPAIYNFNQSIPSQYLNNNFKFRLRWVTDASDNNYDGCAVDDLKISKFSDGSDAKYDFYDGTSMAAPHVAGLAALIKGYSPNATTDVLKGLILSSGDDITSLHYTVSSGRRINAHSAMDTLASSYMVNYDANGGTCTPTSRLIAPGATSAAPSCSRTGYVLTGFTRIAGSGGDLEISSGAVTNTSGDQTIQANWNIYSYQIYYDANGGTCT